MKINKFIFKKKGNDKFNMESLVLSPTSANQGLIPNAITITNSPAM